MAEENEQEPYEDPRSRYINIPEVRKTYLLTDKLETQLPAEFVFSDNKRYIEVQNVRFYDCNKKNYPEDAFMHVNFIYDKPYLDGCVGPVNHIATKYKLYPFKSNDDVLKLRFSKTRSTVIKDTSRPRVIYGNFDDTMAWDPKKSPKYQEYNDLQQLAFTTFTKVKLNSYTEPPIIYINFTPIDNIFDNLKTGFPNYFSDSAARNVLNRYEQYYETNIDVYTNSAIVDTFLEILVWYRNLVVRNEKNYKLCDYGLQYLDCMFKAFDIILSELGTYVNNGKIPCKILSAFIPIWYFAKNPEAEVDNFMGLWDALVKDKIILPNYGTGMRVEIPLKNIHKELALYWLEVFEVPGNEFTLCMSDLNVFKRYGTLYLNYGRTVPAEAQRRVRFLFTALQMNAFSYDKLIIRYNHELEALYKDPEFAVSDALRFCHVCAICSGKVQEPLEYHEVEWAGVDVKQVAIDSLSGLSVERVIQYAKRYAKIKSPIVSVLNDTIEPYMWTEDKYLIYSEFTKQIVTDELFTVFDEHIAATDVSKLEYQEIRDELRKEVTEAMDSGASTNFVTNIGPDILTIIADEIIGTFEYEYLFHIKFLKVIHENLSFLINTSDEPWTAAIHKLSLRNYSDTDKLHTFVRDVCSRNVYREFIDDYSILVSLPFSDYNIALVDLYFASYVRLMDPDQFITFVFRMIEVGDIVNDFVNFDNRTYSFYTTYYGLIEFYESSLDKALVYTLAYDCFKQIPLSDIKTEISAVAAYDPMFKYDAENDIGKYYYVMCAQMLLMLAGVSLPDESMFTLVNTEVNDETKIDYYSINARLNPFLESPYALTYTETTFLDDVPDEQIEFDEHGKEKYNYRFLAEFMLVY